MPDCPPWSLAAARTYGPLADLLIEYGANPGSHRVPRTGWTAGRTCEIRCVVRAVSAVCVEDMHRCVDRATVHLDECPMFLHCPHLASARLQQYAPVSISPSPLSNRCRAPDRLTRLIGVADGIWAAIVLHMVVPGLHSFCPFLFLNVTVTELIRLILLGGMRMTQ
jgi:hypothetical protein